jgi:ribose-phosphate pyrophosphokinase
MVYLTNNRVTSLADRLKVDFALIHSDRTRGSHQARCSPTIPGTPENDASVSSNNNSNSNNLFYLTSNTTTDHNTTAKRSSDDNDDDDEFSSATSTTGEAPSIDDETDSVITLVGDVAGKVAFIVVSYF